MGGSGARAETAKIDAKGREGQSTIAGAAKHGEWPLADLSRRSVQRVTRSRQDAPYQAQGQRPDMVLTSKESKATEKGSRSSMAKQSALFSFKAHVEVVNARGSQASIHARVSQGYQSKNDGGRTSPSQ